MDGCMWLRKEFIVNQVPFLAFKCKLEV